MVFYTKREGKISQEHRAIPFEHEKNDSIPEYSYNWPYDFFSFVEMVKLDAEVKISPVDKDVDSKLVINTDSEMIAEMAISRYKEWVTIHERPKEKFI